ncbi:hypothetical protein B0H13DRAFT_1864407 [Mycena leptocephala]|nr:hypothetical protein B0H13DRAFT_1864407 [Mycena leptocephala]
MNLLASLHALFAAETARESKIRLTPGVKTYLPNPQSRALIVNSALINIPDRASRAVVGPAHLPAPMALFSSTSMTKSPSGTPESFSRTSATFMTSRTSRTLKPTQRSRLCAACKQILAFARTSFVLHSGPPPSNQSPFLPRPSTDLPCKVSAHSDQRKIDLPPASARLSSLQVPASLQEY